MAYGMTDDYADTLRENTYLRALLSEARTALYQAYRTRELSIIKKIDAELAAKNGDLSR